MKEEPCFCSEIRHAAHAITEAYDLALAPSGLKITMFRVLRQLSLAGDPTISELAELVELDRSSLGRNLKVLERQKFVRFANGTDGRSKVVQLTNRGKAALEEALPLWLETRAKMNRALGRDRHLIADVLTRSSSEASRSETSQ